MKKTKISILSLSVLLTLGVFNTSCSSDSDTIAQTETKSATTNEESLIGIWKQDSISQDFYIQFNNGLFSGGPDIHNPFMVSKYYLEEGNIILQTNIGYSPLPYSFRDGKLIVIQNDREEIYSYYGSAIEGTTDFKNFEMLYRSNWTKSEKDNTQERLTLKFLDNGQFKYSYDEYNVYSPTYKLDKLGTYRIEKNQIYMDWNDGKGETVQTITILGGTLVLSSDEAETRFDQC